MMHLLNRASWISKAMLGLLVLVISAVSVHVTLAGDWTMFGGGLDHHGSVRSFTPKLNEYLGGSLFAETWDTPVPGVDTIDLPDIDARTLAGDVVGQPVIDGDVAYFNSQRAIWAYNLTTQEWIWHELHPDELDASFSTPVVTDTAICYGLYLQIVCRNKFDGTLLWTFPEESDADYGKYSFYGFSPMVANGRLWISTTRNLKAGGTVLEHAFPKLYALDEQTGAKLLEIFAPSGNGLPPILIGTPVIDDGRVIFTVVDVNPSGREVIYDQPIGGRVIAVSETDGSLLWRHEFGTNQGTPYRIAPVLYRDNVVLALDSPTHMLALNKTDGTLVWDTPFVNSEAMMDKNPVVYGGKIFMSTDRMDDLFGIMVYALDASDGHIVWQNRLPNYWMGYALCVADSKVFVGAIPNVDEWDWLAGMAALNTNDGAILWEWYFQLTGDEPPDFQEFYGMGFCSISGGKVFGATRGPTIKVFNSLISHSEAVHLDPAIPAVFDGRVEADSWLDIFALNIADGILTVTKTLDGSAADKPPQFGEISLNKFLDIGDPDNLAGSMDYAGIKLYYSDDDVADAGVLDENDMRLYGWDGSNWVELRNSSVDPVLNFIYGETTHFSAFGSGGLPKDSDGDSVIDIRDNCPFIANSGQDDPDGDNRGNECDNCPLNRNGNQLDTDVDGVGNDCDDDDDGDGIPDSSDLCPFIAVPQNDTDNDGVGDDCDNCVFVVNADQSNVDGDAFGDVCDSDIDGDFGLNTEDNCVRLASFDPFTDQYIPLGDADGDGFGNECDNCIYSPNPTQADSDGDGIGDVCDCVNNNLSLPIVSSMCRIR